MKENSKSIFEEYCDFHVNLPKVFLSSPDRKYRKLEAGMVVKIVKICIEII